MNFKETALRLKPRLTAFSKIFLKIYVAGTAILLALVVLVAMTPLGKALEHAQQSCTTRFEDLREADAIVILGGDEGTRALAAMKAFRAGKAPLIVISADEDRLSDALRAGAVPADAVKIDTLAKRTIDHPETILEIPGISLTKNSSVIVTSSRLQERRAKFLFEKSGYKDVQIFSLEADFERFREENPEKYPEKLFHAQRLINVFYAYLAWMKYFLVD